MSLPPGSYISPSVMKEAIRILKSSEYREWSPYESRDLTERAIHRLIRARMFEGRSRGRLVEFRTGKPRYQFRIKLTGGWNQLDVMMPAVEETNQVDPSLWVDGSLAQPFMEVRTDDYYEVRFTDFGEQAAAACKRGVETEEAAVRDAIIEASLFSYRASVYIDQWEDLQKVPRPNPTSTSSSQATATSVVNITLPTGEAAKREPNRELEKPDQKYHDLLMQCVHKHVCQGVVWEDMPEAVAGDGFYRHAKGNLNAWYNDWKTNQPSV